MEKAMNEAKVPFPSLYVRVYHVVPSLLLSFRLSITICEGISMIREMMEYIRIFPHYT